MASSSNQRKLKSKTGPDLSEIMLEKRLGIDERQGFSFQRHKMRIFLVSFVIILIISFVHYLLGRPLFTTDFKLGIIFWLLGWFLNFTEAAVAFEEKMLWTGGLYPALFYTLAYRRMKEDERKKMARFMTRAAGFIFLFFGFLLITSGLWNSSK